MKRTKIIISGGGTGGHVFPAIAIADAIKEVAPSTEILFVGAKGKIEMDRVPKAGYPIKGLWISGFHRKLTLRNLLFPIKLLSSLIKAAGIVRTFKPNVVVGVGGYASGPLLNRAASKGVPALIQEQNSYAGVTNRLLAAKVDKICVAYDGMERYFPKEKLVLTGNPVRAALAETKVEQKAAFTHFGFDSEKSTICLFGGSLGASALNRAMKVSYEIIKAHPEIQILWQAGKLYVEEYTQTDTAKLDHVKITDFVDRMDYAYAMADVVICRAGALTIAEVCMLGKAAILVPSPNVAEDHQTKNAMALVEKGAAVLVKDQDAASTMIEKALELIENEAVRQSLEQHSKQLAKENAAQKIAQEVLSLVK